MIPGYVLSYLEHESHLFIRLLFYAAFAAKTAPLNCQGFCQWI